MPIIRVELLAGRTLEQKRALIAELTAAAVRTINVRPEQVRVLLHELPPEHWGVGGQMIHERRADTHQMTVDGHQ